MILKEPIVNTPTPPQKKTNTKTHHNTTNKNHIDDTHNTLNQNKKQPTAITMQKTKDEHKKKTRHNSAYKQNINDPPTLQKTTNRI